MLINLVIWIINLRNSKVHHNNGSESQFEVNMKEKIKALDAYSNTNKC